jgi:hypothetical protein
MLVRRNGVDCIHVDLPTRIKRNPFGRGRTLVAESLARVLKIDRDDVTFLMVGPDRNRPLDSQRALRAYGQPRHLMALPGYPIAPKTMPSGRQSQYLTSIRGC